jgi:hypothetical protein
VQRFRPALFFYICSFPASAALSSNTPDIVYKHFLISPDFLGDEGHDICILLNEAYSVLSQPTARAEYNQKLEQTLTDYEDDYTGEYSLSYNEYTGEYPLSYNEYTGEYPLSYNDYTGEYPLSYNAVFHIS